MPNFVRASLQKVLIAKKLTAVHFHFHMSKQSNVARSKDRTIRGVLKKFQFYNGQMIVIDFYKASWCIVTMKQLFRKFLRNSMTLIRHSSLYHLGMIVSYVSNTTRCIILLDLKSRAIIFFFTDSYNCIFIFQDLNFVLRYGRYIIVV